MPSEGRVFTKNSKSSLPANCPEVLKKNTVSHLDKKSLVVCPLDTIGSFVPGVSIISIPLRVGIFRYRFVFLVIDVYLPPAPT